ncbi:MAG TPA: flagellar hook protein FlgE [Kofleriaceae bacterium]|nr:flagellar hook protein FlgE [Kofleriaceae bacterium]
MSIWNNLYIGISGLNAHGNAISVVGDNIANVSTVGFKASRAGFSNVMGGMAGAARLGGGVHMDGTQVSFGQGILQQTGGTLDMAVSGRGFFAVNGNHNGTPGNYYTRDGRFNIDTGGFIVNPEGLRLQGYMFDPTGVQGQQVGDLQLGALQSQPLATTAANLSLNLDATEPIAPAWDPADPEATSTFATSTTVYDSLGNGHKVDMYFRNGGAGAWDWHAMVDGAELNGGGAGPGVPTEIGSGSLTFDTSGHLDTETTAGGTADFLGAEPGQVIGFDFGDSITTDGGTGTAGTTQYAGASTVNASTQNGFGFGSLVDMVVSENGTIEGLFSNGQRRAVARVALATFTAEEGLARESGQLFRETTASGQALVDAAATGSRGSVFAGNLEASNVDLTNELVTLIAYQRAFQANVKTVQTADEMLTEVANLKR